MVVTLRGEASGTPQSSSRSPPASGRSLAHRASAAANGSKAADRAAERFFRGMGRSEWERTGGGRGRRRWAAASSSAAAGERALGMPGRCSQENGTAEKRGEVEAELEKERDRELVRARGSSGDPAAESVGIFGDGSVSSIVDSHSPEDKTPGEEKRDERFVIVPFCRDPTALSLSLSCDGVVNEV